MKGFKDIVRADVSRIFLNPEEFGETHSINGKEYKIVLDDNEEVERRITKGAFAYREGNYRVQKLFYVAAEAFGRLPPVGRNLSLDGKVIHYRRWRMNPGSILSVWRRCGRGCGFSG